ncbi:glycosyltransferase family 4 protein [Thermomonospora catenispora]|uniref:glycosyltransferase family 4 protein n=1 Tax=Thermomonospora catenispora TaxID=2493090 RepID=UPI001123755F|nr:glycosyltransferase family 4 protein [Thermomonospora catenispora]TNY38602.1 glycosyltransferase family 4 protein [Thermomonospora catenispora]
MSSLGAVPLRVALVAPPWFDVPPRAYGGIEAMVADLATALDRRGHEVVLIGAGRNGTPARFLPTYAEAPSPRLGEPVPEVVHAAAATRLLDELDVHIVHDHSLAGPLTARGRAVPTVATVHGPVTGDLARYYAELGDAVGLVALSDAQRRAAPGLNWVGTVPNAVDVDTFPFRADKEDFVLFIGRFNPDKGAHLAIDAARAAGRRIVLAGKLNERPERDYFAAEIEPRLGPDVEYVGEADGALKRDLFSRARCLLFPIQWEEPFGMVMIEAMACGTPVVALGRGAVPEVVVDGRTGYILDDPADLPEAVDRVDRIRPADCREHVAANFDVSVMGRRYEQVYLSLLGLPAGRPPFTTVPDGLALAG